MNNLNNQKVKIFFKNNSMAEGVVREYSEKQMVLSTNNDPGYLIIFNPHENILMIRVFKSEEKKEQENIDLPNKSIRQRTGFDRYFDKKMENTENKEQYQEVRKEISAIDQLKNRAKQKYIPNQMPINDILKEMGMANKKDEPFKEQPIKEARPNPVAMIINAPKPIENKTDQLLSDYLVKEIRETDLRYKKLAELKALQIKEEKEAIRKKLTTFESNQNNKVNYGYPTKLGTVQYTPKKDIRSLRTDIERLSSLQRKSS